MTLEKLTQRNQQVAALKALWLDLLPGEQPTVLQFHVWCDLHNVERISHAIYATARKMEALGSMTLEHKIRFASKVANDTKRRHLQIVATNDVSVAQQEG